MVIPFDWPTQPNPSPRPTRHDPDVVLAAASEAADVIIRQWWEDDNPNRDELIDDLTHSMSRESDGYSICRHLEQYHGWYPDSNLVDILERSFLYDAKNKAVKKWVEINGIRPQFTVDTKVMTPGGSGTITHIHEESAQYIVRLDDDHQHYVPFENTTAL